MGGSKDGSRVSDNALNVRRVYPRRSSAPARPFQAPREQTSGHQARRRLGGIVACVADLGRCFLPARCRAPYLARPFSPSPSPSSSSPRFASLGSPRSVPRLYHTLSPPNRPPHVWRRSLLPSLFAPRPVIASRPAPPYCPCRSLRPGRLSLVARRYAAPCGRRPAPPRPRTMLPARLVSHLRKRTFFWHSRPAIFPSIYDIVALLPPLSVTRVSYYYYPLLVTIHPSALALAPASAPSFVFVRALALASAPSRPCSPPSVD